VSNIASSANPVSLANCMKNIEIDYSNIDKITTKSVQFNSEISKLQAKTETNTLVFPTNPPVSIQVYYDNQIINIADYCNTSSVGITYQVKSDSLNLTSVNAYQDLGINVFNDSDPVFQDKCTSLTINGTDSTPTMRKDKIGVNATEVCGASSDQICTINGYSEQGLLECSCNPGSKSIESTFNIYESSNLPILKCYYKLFFSRVIN
jgi:hypothetical protein